MYIDNSCHVHAHIVKVINVYEYLVVFANKFACDQDNLRKTSQSLIGIEHVYIPIASGMLYHLSYTDLDGVGM